MSDSAPDVRPPPRTVEAWTRVKGHVVAGPPNARFCQCGAWRAPLGASRSDVAAAEADHLANAWPVLLAREEGEPLDAFLARLETARAAAEEVFLELEFLDSGPVPPGAEFPNVSEGPLPAAEEQLAVLDHQLKSLRERLGRS